MAYSEEALHWVEVEEGVVGVHHASGSRGTCEMDQSFPGDVGTDQAEAVVPAAASSMADVAVEAVPCLEEVPSQEGMAAALGAGDTAVDAGAEGLVREALDHDGRVVVVLVVRADSGAFPSAFASWEPGPFAVPSVRVAASCWSARHGRKAEEEEAVRRDTSSVPRAADPPGAG